MTEIYLHIVARMADYIDTHPYGISGHQLSNVELKGCLPGTLLRRCTIDGGEEAGVHCYDGGAPTLQHCIVRGNAMAGVAARDGSRPRLHDCVLEGGFEGGVLAMGAGTRSVMRA